MHFVFHVFVLIFLGALAFGVLGLVGFAGSAQFAELGCLIYIPATA